MADSLLVRSRLAAFAVAGLAAAVPSASAQTFATYHCRDGSEFVAAFFPDTRTVALQLDGKAVTLPSRLAASGSRYGKGGITLWIKGANATLRRAATSTDCTAQ